MDYVKHFSEINWMWQGTESQKQAVAAVEALNIFSDLKEYGPLIAGTIPIDCDVDGSDIDVLCEVKDFTRFQQRIRNCFESQKNFMITEQYSQGDRCVICRFETNRFRFEIYGQRTPSAVQDAFLQMIAEAKLLDIGGAKAKSEIRALKVGGLKTEAAFGRYFGIAGDPFVELKNMSALSLNELRERLKIPSP